MSTPNPFEPPAMHGRQEPVVIGYDAAGRPILLAQTSQAPAPRHHCAVCACDQPAPVVARTSLLGLSPGAAVALVLGGGVLVTAIVIALLLSIAVVAGALAVTSVAVAVSVLALRSMANNPSGHRGRRR